MTGQSWTNTQGGGQNPQYTNTQSTGKFLLLTVTFNCKCLIKKKKLYFVGGKKSGWETGQIRVIGSGVASRRLDENTPENQNIQVISPNNNFCKFYYNEYFLFLT